MPITPFFCRLVPAANCKCGRSDEMVKAAIWNLSVLCDVRPSFSRFAVRLKNDYGKTGILNTEPDQRWKDASPLCDIIKGRPTGLWNTMLCRTYKDAKPLTKTKAQHVTLATRATSHHIKKHDIRADWNPWLQCFENLRNAKFIIYYIHDTQKVYIIKHSTVQQIWPSTVTK